MIPVSPRVIVVLGIGAIVLGIGAYIMYLKSEITTLNGELVTVQAQVTNLRGVVSELSESKSTLQARVVLADAEIERLKNVKVKEKVRIVKEVIPSTCPEAVDWLRKELQ